MNITSDAGDSICIVDKEEVGCVYVSVHYTTFDPSTGINNSANLLRVMRTRIGTNESSCPFHLVGLKTDGGGDHNYKHVQNQLALFVLFLLGNTDKLNMTHGCPGIYFLNTAERAMDFLNIGLSVFDLKSNVQVGNEFLMDEVIGKASLMKSSRAAVHEYDTELPLDISVLERCLGINIDIAASTSTDEPAVITEDDDDKEEIQEARNSIEIHENVEFGHQTNSSGSTSPTITEQFRKLFPGMGWFAGNIYGIRQDGYGNIYDILFEYGDT